jgi:hypothetical protein
MTRTRFNDPRFVGSIMACLHSLSSGLRLGLPLPTLYTPLMEEFASFTTYRYEISLEPHPDLPKTVDGDVLSMPDYQRFSVAITTAYAIVNRLDKLTCK